MGTTNKIKFKELVAFFIFLFKFNKYLNQIIPLLFVNADT